MVPDTKALIAKYKDAQPDVIYKRVGGEMSKTEDDFITKNNAKADSIRNAWYCTILGLVIVFLYVISLFL
jgi:hypothetical protein